MWNPSQTPLLVPTCPYTSSPPGILMVSKCHSSQWNSVRTFFCARHGATGRQSVFSPTSSRVWYFSGAILPFFFLPGTQNFTVDLLYLLQLFPSPSALISLTLLWSLPVKSTPLSNQREFSPQRGQSIYKAILLIWCSFWMYVSWITGMSPDSLHNYLTFPNQSVGSSRARTIFSFF